MSLRSDSQDSAMSLSFSHTFTFKSLDNLQEALNQIDSHPDVVEQIFSEDNRSYPSLTSPYLNKYFNKMSSSFDCKEGAMSSSTPISPRPVDSSSYVGSDREANDERLKELLCAPDPPSIVKEVSQMRSGGGHFNDQGIFIPEFDDVEFDVEGDQQTRLFGSSAPFVPQYDPTISKAVLLNLIRMKSIDASEIGVILESKGYPASWISSIVQSCAHGSRLARIMQIKHVSSRRENRPIAAREHSHSAKAPRTVGGTAGTKTSGSLWRIHARPFSPLCQKPVVHPCRGEVSYSHDSFIKWVYGQAAMLQKHLEKKTQYVTGNDSCAALFHADARHATDSTLTQLLESAAVFIADYTDRNRAVPSRFMSDFVVWDKMPVPKTLTICGTTVTNLSQLQVFEQNAFKRHKPLYKFAVCYFGDDSDVDGDSLQRQINEKINLKFSKESVQLQGATQSAVAADGTQVPYATIQHNHAVAVNSDLLSQVAEVAEQIGEGFAETYGRVILQVSSFIAALASAKDWVSALAAVMQFVSGNNYAFKYCHAIAQRIPRTTETLQGAGDAQEASWISAMWDTIVGSSVCVLISEFFKSIADAVCAPVMDLVKSIRFSLLKESGAAIAKVIIAGIMECLTRIKSCITQKSLSPLWGSSWDPRRWIFEVEAMITYFPALTCGPEAGSTQLCELRKEGRIPDYWVEPVSISHFVDIGENHYIAGRKMQMYFATNADVNRLLITLLAKFRAFLDDRITSFNADDEKVESATILFYGPAGTGKSGLCAQTIKSIARVRGYDPKRVHHWQPAANFQDELDHTHWGVVMDDVDQGVAPDAAGFVNHVESFIGLVNTKPYPVEKAGVNDKGKFRAYPLIVAICTNYFDFKVTKKIQSTEPFWRRVDFHVTVRVKPGFAMPDADILDKDLAADSCTHDMFILEVRKFNPALIDPSNRNKAPLDPPVEMSYPDFNEMFLKHFHDKLEREKRKIARRGLITAICPRCGLDTTRDCGHFVPQGKCEDVTESVKGKFSSWVSQAKVLAASLNRRLGSTWATQLSNLNINLSQLRVQAQELNKFVDKHESKLLWTLAAVAGLSLTGGILTLRLVHQYYQGREQNGVGGLIPMAWMRAQQNFVPGLPQNAFQSTYTKEDLLDAVIQCHVEVSGPKYSMHGFLISQNILLVPTHVASDGEEIRVTKSGRDVRLVVTPLNRAILDTNKELCIVRCGEFRGDINLTKKMWAVVDEQIQSFDAVEIIGSTSMYYPDSNNVALKNGSRLITTSSHTQVGDCGLLYLGQFGKSWKIVAMHYGLHETATIMGHTYSSMGAIVTTQEIDRLATRLGTKLQGIEIIKETLSKNPSDISLSRFQYKSEVWAAMSHYDFQVYPFGELYPALSGSTTKSKVTKSLIYDEASERFEQEWCGHRGYWNLPDFRGSMVDDKWLSPYTNACTTQNRKVPDQFLLSVAVMDYLNGMQFLDNTGYSVLSEEQVLTGIPGSYVHSVNLKTSVGPPFNQSKRNHMYLDSKDGSYMNENVWKMIDLIEDCLERGDIPTVVALWTLKDEAIKKGKIPRIFNCLPFAFNFILKKYFAAWQSFMRANFAFFESAVGINMTSPECNKIVQFLKQVCPEFTALFDADGKMLDKSFSGEFFDRIAQVVYAISWFLGTAPFKAMSLVYGVKFCIHCVKNDLFSVFHNVSGQDATVSFNGLVISIGERYVYYEERVKNFSPEFRECVTKFFETFFENPIPPPRPEFTFRRDVALVTYGDDQVKNCGVPLNPRYQEIWKDQLGVIVTDASKSLVMVPKRLSEIQFLKRSLIWDEELQSYVPPIDKKSIMRMLLIKKESFLTKPDHICVNMTGALKEAVYHGREFYDELYEFCENMVVKYQLSLNPYLVMKPFEFWRDSLKNGTFQTWDVISVVNPIELSESITIFQGKMSNITMAKAGNDPAQNNESNQTKTNINYNVGSMVSDSTMVMSTADSSLKFFQNVPTNDIADFVTRATEIATVQVTQSDLVLGIVATIDPWALYLANTRVIEKTASYSLIRGTIQVIVSTALPGNAYGSYVVAAIPNGGNTVSYGAATGLYPENCMQVDHYGRIDCSDSENIVLQLPWMWPTDFAPLPTGPVGAWGITITCLSPVGTAIPGGVTIGNFKIFANLLDDYVLSVPHIQGQPTKHLKPNHAMKTMAPKVHAKIEKAKQVVNVVENVAEKLESVPIIGPYAETAVKAAHAAKKIAGWFGFTRDSVPSNPIGIQNKSVSNLAHFEGPDTGESSSLALCNEISIDPTLAGFSDQDCMANTSIFDRWTIVKTMSWSTAAASGTTIGSIPVSPFYARGSHLGNTNYSFNLTTAGYVGLPFYYWRGDMEYRIIIPVSKLHRGTLQILWIPVGSVLPATVTNTTLNIIYDVSAGGEQDFTVGFARDIPYLESRLITDSLAIVPQGATNGRLYFRVINPLLSPNSTVDVDVDIIILAKACANMDFAVPTWSIPFTSDDGLSITDYTLYDRVTLQGASGDEDNHESQSLVLVAPSGEYPGEQLLFGERFESVRALLQKPSHTYMLAVSPVADQRQFLYPQFGGLPSITGGTPYPWTWAGWYRPLFTGLACSERFKLLSSNSEDFFGAALLTRAVGSAIPADSTLSPTTISGPSRGVEFTIPYYHPKKFALGREMTTAAPGRLNLVFQNRVPGATSFAAISTYHSLGPDIRVTCFRQIPTVWLLNQVTRANASFWQV
jgi:hypothetical protein